MIAMTRDSVKKKLVSNSGFRSFRNRIESGATSAVDLLLRNQTMNGRENPNIENRINWIEDEIMI